VVTIQISEGKRGAGSVEPRKYLTATAEGRLDLKDEAAEGDSSSHFRLMFADEEKNVLTINHESHESKSDEKSNAPLGSAKALPLFYGQPLRLQSVRWPDFEIGYQARQFSGKDAAKKGSLMLTKTPEAILRAKATRTWVEFFSGASVAATDAASPLAMIGLSALKRSASGSGASFGAPFGEGFSFPAGTGAASATGAAAAIYSTSAFYVEIQAVVQMMNRLSGDGITAYFLTFRTTTTTATAASSSAAASGSSASAANKEGSKDAGVNLFSTMLTEEDFRGLIRLLADFNEVLII
jgi:hypothetical protein